MSDFNMIFWAGYVPDQTGSSFTSMSHTFAAHMYGMNGSGNGRGHLTRVEFYRHSDGNGTGGAWLSYPTTFQNGMGIFFENQYK
jgi:hypothetical protein